MRDVRLLPNVGHKMSGYNYHGKGSAKHRVEKKYAPKIDKINVLAAMSPNKTGKTMILMGWNLALRSKEIAGLRVANFDFQDMTVEIPNDIAKGDSGGIITVVSRRFMSEMQDYIFEKELSCTMGLFNDYPLYKLIYTEGE